ncbi:putative ribonuclease H-like domain-containing protein [Tanacetum coccineum]
MNPMKISEALEDESWVMLCRKNCCNSRFKSLDSCKLWPYGKKAIGTKWVYKNKKDERGVVVRNKARLVAQGHRQEEGIDYDEVSTRQTQTGRLWYPRVSSFDLEAYSDSDYAGANLDRKSIIGVCKSILNISDEFQDVNWVFKSHWEEIQTHNMVTYLEKTEGNAEFHEVIDFLTRSFIHHALTLVNVPVPLDHFPINALTSKVFSFMVKKGKHFSGKVTPLFASMLVQSTEDEATIEPPSDPSPRPSPSTHILDSIPESSGGNHGGQSSSDKSLPGNEGDMTLQSVYDLCISLCTQVTDQAKEIKHLKAQVKKLNKQAKPIITHHRAWIKSVSLKKRLAGKKPLKENWMQKESVSKQGRKSAKAEPSVHTNPLFDELPDDTMDYMDTKEAQDVGRKREVVDEEKEGTKDAVSTTDIVSTNKEKVSTDRSKVSTDRSKDSTDKEEEGTDKDKDSTVSLYEGIDDRTKARSATPIPSTTTLTMRWNDGVKDTDQKRLKEEDTVQVPAKEEVKEQGTKKRKGGHIKMIARQKAKKISDMTLILNNKSAHKECYIKSVPIDSEIMEKKSVIARLDKVSSPDEEYLVIHRANVNFRAFNYLMESNQQDWKIITWRLYEACGAYILELEDEIVIHMLVERRYPLLNDLLQRMLDLGLEVERESIVALDLIRIHLRNR